MKTLALALLLCLVPTFAAAADCTIEREIVVNGSYPKVVEWWKTNYVNILGKLGVSITQRKGEEVTVFCHPMDTDWKFSVQEKMEEAGGEFKHTTKFLKSESGGLKGHTADIIIKPTGDKTKIVFKVFVDVDNTFVRSSYHLRVLMSVAYVKTRNQIAAAFPLFEGRSETRWSW